MNINKIYSYTIFAKKYINKLKPKYQENTFVQRIVIEYKMYIRPPKIANKCIHTRWLACWTKLIIFQLYRGCQFYWWRKLEYPEKTTYLSLVTDNGYHIVVSSTPRHVGYSNFSCNRYWLHNTYDLHHDGPCIHTNSDA
jgi:hypothetical protein